MISLFISLILMATGGSDLVNAGLSTGNHPSENTISKTRLSEAEATETSPPGSLEGIVISDEDRYLPYAHVAIPQLNKGTTICA